MHAAAGYRPATLRRAGQEDAAALSALFREARPEGDCSERGMRTWLEHGGALLLEDRGHLLAALRWREEAAGWRVDRVTSLPQARGQGYGRWLMTKVEALAIRSNIPTLTLELDDRELLPYYGRMGYRPDDDAAGEAGLLTLRKRVGGTWQVQQERA
jgi:GNAT superfamily N-acetyltransferase